MNPARLALLGMAIILVGIIVVAFGALTASGGASSSGGFILIGPFPIVFGNGPNSGMLATAGLVITVAMVALYLASFFLWRSGVRHEANAEPESE
jgi:uncharacterized membrane protein